MRGLNTRRTGTLKRFSIPCAHSQTTSTTGVVVTSSEADIADSTKKTVVKTTGKTVVKTGMKTGMKIGMETTEKSAEETNGWKMWERGFCNRCNGEYRANMLYYRCLEMRRT